MANRNFLIPYTLNNDIICDSNKEFNNLTNINDAIGFNDYTYIISVNDNVINIYSYLNQYNYDKDIYLNLEKSYNGNYTYVCSGKIDNLIDYNYKTKSKRIFVLFKSTTDYLIYYNDEFNIITNEDNIEIEYLDKVNYGIKLGFTKIINGKTKLFYIDNNFNIQSIFLNELLTNDFNILANNINYKCYCYKNDNYEEINIVDNKFNINKINEITYCCDKINNKIIEYFNFIIKLDEIEEGIITNTQRLIYHIIKYDNEIKYCYNYYLGFDKDNIDKINLTNLIFNNCLMTVDNLNNNAYVIQLLNNFNNININYLNLNDDLIDKDLYKELQLRKTINNGLNKYVMK